MQIELVSIFEGPLDPDHATRYRWDLNKGPIRLTANGIQGLGFVPHGQDLVTRSAGIPGQRFHGSIAYPRQITLQLHAKMPQEEFDAIVAAFGLMLSNSNDPDNQLRPDTPAMRLWVTNGTTRRWIGVRALNPFPEWHPWDAWQGKPVELRLLADDPYFYQVAPDANVDQYLTRLIPTELDAPGHFNRKFTVDTTDSPVIVRAFISIRGPLTHLGISAARFETPLDVKPFIYSAFNLAEGESLSLDSRLMINSARKVVPDPGGGLPTVFDASRMFGSRWEHVWFPPGEVWTLTIAGDAPGLTFDNAVQVSVEVTQPRERAF